VILLLFKEGNILKGLDDLKAWQRERMTALVEAIGSLTVTDVAEIERACEAEKAYIRSRDTIKGTFPNSSSFKRPMIDARAFIKTLPTNDANVWVNPKNGEKEHIILKFLNWSVEEWAAMNGQSVKRMHERKETQLILADPYQIVAKAEQLLASENWQEVVIGLAVVSGRRLSEIGRAGDLQPYSTYTAIFSGQLKTKVLKPYEVPLLLPSGMVIAAWSRLRSLVDLSHIEDISKAYGTELSAAARVHFAELVPVWEGYKGLFVKAFREVYACVAINWFCPVDVQPDTYASTILGHWWEGPDGEQLRDYAATLHYTDYAVSDGQGNIDGRRGVRLSEPGVKVLDIFMKDGKPLEKGKRAMPTKSETLEVQERTKRKRSIIQVSDETKAAFDPVKAGRTEDETVKALIREHNTMQALLAACGSDSVESLLALVQDAATDKGHEDKPVTHLKEVLVSKRKFKESYDGRHEGKDYTSMRTSDLIKHKTKEAAIERFKRGVDALMAANQSVDLPELRWFINAPLLIELVGGAPTLAKEYIDGRPDVAQHHKDLEIKAGFNRRSVSVKERVQVPELPESEG
jgi:Telomere resolvase